MHAPDDKDAILLRLKRHPLSLSSDGTVTVSYGPEVVRQLLPHRPPMAFIDRIEALNLQDQLIEATSLVPEDAPVFAGHFPGNPLYPGVLQIETMGQAALCLVPFLRAGQVEVPADAQPIPCLFTRVHHAGFLRPIPPGRTLTVRAKALECDDFIGLMAAQVLVDGQICAHAVLEAHFL